MEGAGRADFETGLSDGRARECRTTWQMARANFIQRLQNSGAMC